MRTLFFAVLASLILHACYKDTGSLKITYSEATPIYGNLDDIRSQSLNDDPRNIEDPGKVYLGEDFILIGEEGKGIHVIDNNDITNPMPIGFINIPGNREYVVEDNYLYAESIYDIVKIDLSDISTVRMVGRAENVFSTPVSNDKGEYLIGFSFQEVTKEINVDDPLFEAASNNKTVYRDFAQNIIPPSAVPVSFSGSSSGINGSVNRLSIYKDKLYIAARSEIHVLNKFQTSLVETISNVAEEMETIFPYDDKLFVGTRTSVEIFGIDDQGLPNHAFTFDHNESCDPVLPHNDVAYVTLRTGDFDGCPGTTNALVVLDINNINNPKEILQLNLDSPFGMNIDKDYLYIGEGQAGLTVFDISDPGTPKNKVNYASITAYDVLTHPTKDLLLVAGDHGVSIYTKDENKTLELQAKISY